MRDSPPYIHEQHPPEQHPPDVDPSERHPIERLMDNPWLLLLLGVVVPFLSYTVWGWIELATMPQALLP